MDADVKADTESKTLAEADKFVQSLVKRADVTHPYPLWHGWALREAYRAGYEAARKARAAAEAGGER